MYTPHNEKVTFNEPSHINDMYIITHQYIDRTTFHSNSMYPIINSTSTLTIELQTPDKPLNHPSSIVTR